MERLRTDFIDAKPRDFDFGQGYGQTWETVDPFDAMEASALCDFIEERQGSDADALEGWCEDPAARRWHYAGDDDEEDAREALVEKARDCADPDDFAPMMNYTYPAPDDDPATMQAKLDGLPLVVVLVCPDDDPSAYPSEPRLALSGGGMDLSWEICEAYIRLGYYPPLHFAEVPRMAGRGANAEDLAILEACIRSAEIAAGWAQHVADRLRDRIAQDAA